MAIRVDGATHIGSGKGYDLFDIITYQAAQEFVNARSNNPAGDDFVQNEQTFVGNINERVHLYFFVESDTNRVKYAVVMQAGAGANSTITINGSNTNVDIQTNILLESSNNHSSTILRGDKIPLYLLPNVEVSPEIDDNGCYIVDNCLVAVFPHFCEAEVIQELNCTNLPYSHNIESISENAFKFGQKISRLVMPQIGGMPANVICSDIEHVCVTSNEAPQHWDLQWNRGFEDRTEFNYGISEEERAELLARQEAERQQAELARRAEEERLAREEALKAEREARKIRYRIEGDHVVIKGTRKGVTNLEIPSEIEGKPVTKIEAYAFYGNADLVRVTLPPTLKIIERAAFDDMGHSPRITAPVDCIIGKDNKNVRRRRS